MRRFRVRVGVMTTDGGAHPASKWAEETAGEIMSYVKIDPDSADDSPETAALKKDARRSKMRLEADIVYILEPHHEENIRSEQGHLHASDERLCEDCAPDHDCVAEATDAVVEAAKKYGPLWAAAFDSVNGREIVANAIRVHFASAMLIERSYHADRKVARGEVSEHVRKFKKGE